MAMRALACNDGSDMSRRLGIAVIGTGWMGAARSRAYLQARHRLSIAGWTRGWCCASARSTRGGKRHSVTTGSPAPPRTRARRWSRRMSPSSPTRPNFPKRAMANAAIAAGKHVFPTAGGAQPGRHPGGSGGGRTRPQSNRLWQSPRADPRAFLAIGGLRPGRVREPPTATRARRRRTDDRPTPRCCLEGVDIINVPGDDSVRYQTVIEEDHGENGRGARPRSTNPGAKSCARLSPPNPMRRLMK